MNKLFLKEKPFQTDNDATGEDIEKLWELCLRVDDSIEEIILHFDMLYVSILFLYFNC